MKKHHRHRFSSSFQRKADWARSPDYLTDPPRGGGEVVYEGEEIFRGHPYPTEDLVKEYLSIILTDPNYPGYDAVWKKGKVDEDLLGRIVADYFRIKGIENLAHPLWDWVEDVVDNITKRRFSSTKKRGGSNGVTADVVKRRQKIMYKKSPSNRRHFSKVVEAKRGRISREQLRGLRFAQPVEFLYPDTGGQEGFGRIMDFTRTPEGVMIDIAPHLYKEGENWFRQDPHDFVTVHIDDVFPTDKPFNRFIREAPWPRKGSSYGTEMSSPMFRTDGGDNIDLETEIVEDLLSDSNMRELAEVAVDMSAQKVNSAWQELAEYIQYIYSKYGREEGHGVDWNEVAQQVYDRIDKYSPTTAVVSSSSAYQKKARRRPSRDRNYSCWQGGRRGRGLRREEPQQQGRGFHYREDDEDDNDEELGYTDYYPESQIEDEENEDYNYPRQYRHHRRRRSF